MPPTAAELPAPPSAGSAGPPHQESPWVVLLLAQMMLLAPAMGAPSEELLQDSLKSALVAFFTLLSALVFTTHFRAVSLQGQHPRQLHWHGVTWLPLALAAYALASTQWSHAYLASVEAARWLLFTLLVVLGSNTLSLAGVTRLAWGIQLGAFGAAFWAALQFWLDFDAFPQGPNPASTFINRNFFAEYLVCTLPFSVWLLLKQRHPLAIFWVTFSTAFSLAALLMTGTRSALLALLVLAPGLPVFFWCCKKQAAKAGWTRPQAWAVAVLFLASFWAVGQVNTGNLKLKAEFGHINAFDRAASRIQSVTQAEEYTQGSFSIRATLWKASARMVQAHPLAGVGAGAWEVHLPLYQAPGSQIETDYYAHNEPLQLVAEYGLVGGLFLAGLAGYLLWATWQTFANHTSAGEQERPLRLCALASLLMLLIVSNAGFPWRMAATGALFALSLGLLAASDIRLLWAGSTPESLPESSPEPSKKLLTKSPFLLFFALRFPYVFWAQLALLSAFLTAGFITWRALECESKIVRAVKLALTISQSANPQGPFWAQDKARVLQLTREAIAINPHYRKLTPAVADALAAWGDWAHATWVWESVLASRPHVVVLLSNAARGHLNQGHVAQAQAYLDRATRLQATAPSLLALQVLVWAQSGREGLARERVQQLLQAGTFDLELLQQAYLLGVRQGDLALAVQSQTLRRARWPAQTVEAWFQLGQLYHSARFKDLPKALEAYQMALDAAPKARKPSVLASLPEDVRASFPAAFNPPLATQSQPSPSGK